MKAPTQFPSPWYAAYEGTRPVAFQGELGKPGPIAWRDRSAATTEPGPSVGAGQTPDGLLTTTQFWKKSFSVSAPLAARQPDIALDSSVIQIWEGTVIDVHPEDGVMEVLLNAKIGNVPSHTGEIELQWVPDQDRELVHPGAIFYLTLYKRTKRGSIENAQELRFRRRPSWTRQQVAQIEREAQMLLSKMKARPLAE